MFGEVTQLWGQFVVSTVIIVVGGFFLVRYADVIAEVTGLGHVWAGVMLLATATSLPELVVGLTSVIAAEALDLAAGNAFGANLVNLLNIAVLSSIPAWRALMEKETADRMQLGMYGIAVAFVGGALVLMGSWSGAADTGILSVLPFMLPVLYMVFAYRSFGGGIAISVRDVGRIFGARPRHLRSAGRLRYAMSGDKMTALRRPLAGYIISAAAVIGAGYWLSLTGDDLAASLGWSQSFFGHQFLSISTALPELTVAIAALRIGAVEMALSDLLGSNIFNLAIVLFLDSVAHGMGAFFVALSEVHVVTALAGILMTMVVILRPRAAIPGGSMGWWSRVQIPALVLLYAAASYNAFTWD